MLVKFLIYLVDLNFQFFFGVFMELLQILLRIVFRRLQLGYKSCNLLILHGKCRIQLLNLALEIIDITFESSFSSMIRVFEFRSEALSSLIKLIVYFFLCSF